MKNSRRISLKDFISLFIRSCTIEASFNYERMMSLGFAFCIEPVLIKIHKNPEDLKSALRRHLGLFNTTSVASPFILGVIVSLEEEFQNDHTFQVDVINKTKSDLMGPLAGVSDGIFWGSLRIVATVIGIAIALNGSYWGPVCFLVLFNIPNLLVRFYGLSLGYQYGVDSLDTILPILEQISLFLNIIVSLLFGAIVVNWISIDIKILVIPEYISPLLSIALFMIVLYCIRRKVKTVTIFWIIILLSISGVYLGIF